MSEIYIKGLSHYIPDGRLSNEDMLDLFKEKNKNVFSKDELEYIMYGNQRKLEFLGSKTRSYCIEESEDNSTSMAIKVAKDAIRNSEIDKNEIECIIFTAVSNPFREPSYAIFLAAQIGIDKGDFFDINDTCNGFLKSMELAKLYIDSGKYKNVLIVTSENPYEISKDLKDALKVKNEKEVDNIISYLFVGSGAAAMVLSSDGKSGKFINYYEQKESNNWDSTIFINPFINIPETRFGNKKSGIWADGRCISSTIIKEMPNFIEKQFKKCNIDKNEIDKVFIHQLGDNVTFATANSLGIDKTKLPINTFSEYGNLACANIPVALSIASNKGILKTNDLIMLFSSSCGISYSLVKIIW